MQAGKNGGSEEIDVKILFWDGKSLKMYLNLVNPYSIGV